MKRSVLFALVAVTASTGCTDPQQQAKIEALETRVAALEARPAGPVVASKEDEIKAGEMLREVSEAMAKGDNDAAKAKAKELSAKYASTQAGKRVARLLPELEVLGKDAVPLDAEQWFQGAAADVENSKAQLYVFWELWCPHCKREVPKLEATYAKFKDSGLGMVGLTKMSRDTQEDDLNAFLTDNKVSYPVAKEDGKLSTHYGVSGVPAAAMVKDGKVVWRGHPARLTDEMIQGWL